MKTKTVEKAKYNLTYFIRLFLVPILILLLVLCAHVFVSKSYLGHWHVRLNKRGMR